MRRLLFFIVITAMGMGQGLAQALIQTYTDRCTGVTQVFTVPMNGQTVVAFYNRSKTFTSQDFQDGTLQAWLEETYLWWTSLSPCSTATTGPTATQQTTQQTTQQATQAATNAAANTTTNVPPTTSSPPPTTQAPKTTAPDTTGKAPDTGTNNTATSGTNASSQGNDAKVPEDLQQARQQRNKIQLQLTRHSQRLRNLQTKLQMLLHPKLRQQKIARQKRLLRTHQNLQLKKQQRLRK